MYIEQKDEKRNNLLLLTRTFARFIFIRAPFHSSWLEIVIDLCVRIADKLKAIVHFMISLWIRCQW